MNRYSDTYLNQQNYIFKFVKNFEIIFNGLYYYTSIVCQTSYFLILKGGSVCTLLSRTCPHEPLLHYRPTHCNKKEKLHNTADWNVFGHRNYTFGPVISWACFYQQFVAAIHTRTFRPNQFIICETLVKRATI